MARFSGAVGRNVKWAITSVALLPVLLLFACSLRGGRNESAYARW